MNRYWQHRILATILLTALCGCLAANNSHPYYRFRQLSIRQGLSDSNVTAFEKDRYGSFYIGTRNGLNCFSGNSIEVFKHNPADSLSLPDNDVTRLYYDNNNEGYLWVATQHGVAMKAGSGPLRRIKWQGSDLNAYSFTKVGDKLLICCKNVIYSYSYDENRMAIWFEEPGRAFEKLIPYGDNLFLVANSHYGIHLLDMNTHTLNDFIPIDMIMVCSAIHLDSHHNLWVTYDNRGMDCYSITARQYRLKRRYTTDSSPLTNDAIQSIVEVNNCLWIATDGGGINILNLDDGQIDVITYVSDDPNSFPSQAVSALYVNGNQSIWAGTVRSGAVEISAVKIRKLTRAPLGSVYGLTNPTVLSLYDDEAGVVWVGTDGGGLNCLDRQTGLIKHFDSTYRMKITSITALNDRQLLLGTYNQGVVVLDKQSGKVKNFTVVDRKTDNAIKHSNVIIQLHRVDQNRFLFFLGDVCFRFDSDTQIFTALGSLEEGNEARIIKSGQRYITLRKGTKIYEIDNELNRIDQIYSNPLTIQSVDVDHNGYYWFADADGVKRLDIATCQTEPLSLPFDVKPTTLLFDHKGQLWMGANEYLVCYSPDQSRFCLFDESDGVPPDNYLSRPILLTSDGYIVMGGNDGLLLIDSNIELQKNRNITDISFKQALLNGKEAQIKQSKHGTTALLPHNFGQLELAFNMTRNSIYGRSIVNFDVVGSYGTLNFVSDNGVITLNSLQSGLYKVTAHYMSKSGEQVVIDKPILYIKVRKPLWRTLPMIALYIIIATTIAAGLYHYLLSRRRRNMELTISTNNQRLAEEKVQFLINISHELRTPLTLIYAPLKRLLESDVKIDQAMHKQLNSIMTQARKMSHLINMVLNARSMEVNGVAIEPISRDMNEWVESVIDEFRLEFEAKDLSLKFEADKSIGSINFDATKCLIVLSNMLMNAMKYSNPATDVTVATTLTTDDYVRISVQDFGKGLGTVDTGKLFDRFYRADTHTSGFGLGLAYSKMLVELHNGRIGAWEDHTKGTVFYFDLPTDLPSNFPNERSIETLLTDQPKTDNAIHFDTSTLTLLLVDDEDEMVQMLKKAYTGLFRTIYTAHNGSEALNTIADKMPDMVVSDIMMPEINGYELCNILKTDINISHIPIILLTARADENSRMQGYKVGADCYVTKPFDIELLLTMIKSILKNRQALLNRIAEHKSIVDPKHNTFSNADEKFMDKLNDYIKDHLDDNTLSVDSAASYMALSRTLLYNKMRALTGQGVMNYINSMRMNHAARLLIDTDRSITDIALQVGFVDNGYFSTVFKNYYGSTPSKYRQQTQAKENHEDKTQQ